MSDIAKKTLPPGSWPGRKGGAKTAETASECQSQTPVPRSVPSPPHMEGEEAGDTHSESHYTHRQDNPLENIGEEGGPIKMTDNAPESMQEVAPEPQSAFEGEEGHEEVHEGEEQESHEEGHEEGEKESSADVHEAAETGSGTGTSLTEQAKEAFDKASQNQPNSEARKSFLQSARDGLTTVSGLTGMTGQKSEQPFETVSQQAPETEGLEKNTNAPEEFEETKSGLQEHPPSASGAAQTVSGKTQGQSEFGQQEFPETAQTDFGQTEQAPTEAGQTENAPTEAGQRAPTVSFKEPSATGTTTESGSHAAGETENAPTQTGYAPTQTGSQYGTQTEATHQTEGTRQTEATHETEGTYPEGAKTAMTGESVTVPEQLDFSILKNGKVNKGGNVVDEDGKVVGRVTSGILSFLIGKKVDENGDIWSDNGKVIGKAEPITDSEREEMLKEPAPFESFPDAVVDGNGMVVSNGEWVGRVVEGDVNLLRGKAVDPDGDIVDKAGNLIGHAERWEPEPEAEPEPEPEVDRSILAGKRVNKAGNVVDSTGAIYGRVVEGDVKNMIGRMCNKNGEILSESGDILGRAEVVSEGEREGLKEGPFAELEGCTVAKDGTVVTPAGDIVGRLVSGDPKMLFGRLVDEDGDVLDKNGNTIGKAERWEPEVVERKKNPMSGRRVNKEGNVVDEDGNIVGKLVSGDPKICSGKEIDDDGDVVDYKGTVIGHCSLLEDIPDEEETPEEKEKREQVEKDRKIATQMSVCIAQCLDKIRPICKMINEKIDSAERTPEDERDEEALVREVRPLIEEGGRILTEAKGIIKGLDPDGRISANAKHKTASREATPEEYHLADVLKDLTGDVTMCIENAKRKLEDMPYAKKELNPLWGLLNEPLFQILAAVGLLLAGVLGLVGRLLSGLGLGGLLDGLLGTLGINRVLEGLGIGSLTGGKKKKKKSGGGLLGGILGG